jgi:glyoxylase-like metal-dependent hydrolase (beta-lactamase superfamily II)
MKIIEFGKDDEGDRVERMKVLEFDRGREPERDRGDRQKSREDTPPHTPREHTSAVSEKKIIEGGSGPVRAEEIFLLDYGWLGGDVGWFLPGAAGCALTFSEKNPPKRWVEIPISGVVVKHPHGNVLFDAGISPDAMETHEQGLMEAFPIVRMSAGNRIENQLRNCGMEPKDIHFIVISHLHLDHIGQLGIFRQFDIPIIVQKRELESALYLLWQNKGGAYDFADLGALRGAAWAPIDDRRLELLDGVVVEWTGGHTAGHQVMHVTTQSGNHYTFTGDYLHLPEEYELEAKGWLLGDAEEWHAYIRKLKLMQKARRSSLVMGHDPDLWNKFPVAPASLK